MNDDDHGGDRTVTPLRTFITRSSYEGAWDAELHMMDGFGTYRYPDGSEYRGAFQHGKFHGYGHLKLATPSKFTVKGEFRQGKLVRIADMWFDDGLHVQGSFENERLQCADWDYLTEADRRYQAERRYNQQPVGPTAFLTKDLIARSVAPKCYDAEEGLYNATTGWLIDRPPPCTCNVYVSSAAQRQWITRNCRRARSAQTTEPLPSFCRRIVHNNLQAEEQQLDRLAVYAPRHVLDRKRYYHKLCAQRAFVPATKKSKDHIRRRPKPVQRCLQCAQKKDKATPKSRARPSTTSDVLCVDVAGATTPEQRSFSEETLVESLDHLCDVARAMQQRFDTSLHVVQSNLLRPASYQHVQRSYFEVWTDLNIS